MDRIIADNNVLLHFFLLENSFSIPPSYFLQRYYSIVSKTKLQQKVTFFKKFQNKKDGLSSISHPVVIQKTYLHKTTSRFV